LCRNRFRTVARTGPRAPRVRAGNVSGIVARVRGGVGVAASEPYKAPGAGAAAQGAWRRAAPGAPTGPPASEDPSCVPRLSFMGGGQGATMGARDADRREWTGPAAPRGAA